MKHILQRRWLDSFEAFSILNRTDLLVKIGHSIRTLSLKAAEISSGDTFVFEKIAGRQGGAIWRQDGLQYEKRKNNSSV